MHPNLRLLDGFPQVDRWLRPSGSSQVPQVPPRSSLPAVHLRLGRPKERRPPFDSFFTRLKQEGKCFRCFRSGHLGFQCRSRQRCFKCRGVGHLGIDCTSSSIHRGQSSVSSISSSALCNNSSSSMSNKPACRPSLIPTPSSLSSPPPFRGIERPAQAGKQIASAEDTIAAHTSMVDRVPFLNIFICPTLTPRIAELIILALGVLLCGSVVTWERELISLGFLQDDSETQAVICGIGVNVDFQTGVFSSPPRITLKCSIKIPYYGFVECFGVRWL
ncbi:zinc knuckle family protein [Canna indica]|uniref:Zinc knuckle family protein n=1 Tax=Canna indica TaxID=4628 RepID=A0AAQ3KZQ2_9LILI|nr:zinc knuckle family protein [Canna indica]